MDLSWLKALAPTVATALGGPLAGVAVSVLGKVFGIDEPTQDKINEALSDGKLTGDQVLQLKQAELALIAQEKELGFKFADLEVQDRKDARAMQATTRSLVPAVLSLLVTGGYFSILMGMMLGELHTSDSQALLLMLGSLSTGWGSVMAFWFGTTHGSANKTNLLARSAPIKE
jgi:zinc transporter ZupT